MFLFQRGKRQLFIGLKIRIFLINLLVHSRAFFSVSTLLLLTLYNLSIILTTELIQMNILEASHVTRRRSDVDVNFPFLYYLVHFVTNRSISSSTGTFNTQVDLAGTARTTLVTRGTTMFPVSTRKGVWV